jgi:hypothetical protein
MLEAGGNSLSESIDWFDTTQDTRRARRLARFYTALRLFTTDVQNHFAHCVTSVRPLECRFRRFHRPHAIDKWLNLAHSVELINSVELSYIRFRNEVSDIVGRTAPSRSSVYCQSGASEITMIVALERRANQASRSNCLGVKV